jgi:large subunit ribosomal protein L35
MQGQGTRCPFVVAWSVRETDGQELAQEETVPKIKTHKATAKRFRHSGSGKLMRTRGGGKGGATHLRRRRSKRSKRLLGEMTEVETRGDVKRIERLAPYMGKK